jgi:hypothetical protein
MNPANGYKIRTENGKYYFQYDMYQAQWHGPFNTADEAATASHRYQESIENADKQAKQDDRWNGTHRRELAGGY